MVGEVRDAETAHVAVHAALTGHLVLTTLHTETAAAAVPRLLDLGVEGYSAAIGAAGGDRAAAGSPIVRALQIAESPIRCGYGGRPAAGGAGFPLRRELQQPCGCERCGGTGYRGRLGVFEVLELTGDLRELIGEKTDGLKIDETAIRAGMTTMLDDGIAKCRAGLTSAGEILRVTTVR